MSPLPTSRGAKAFPWTATNRYPCAAVPRRAMAALVSWYGRWRNNEITRVAAEPRVKTGSCPSPISYRNDSHYMDLIRSDRDGDWSVCPNPHIGWRHPRR